MNKFLTLFLLIATAMLAQGKLTHSSSRSITLSFELPEISQRPLSIGSQDYVRVDYPDSRMRAEAGAPLIPYSVYRIALPPGATVKMQYDILSQRELSATSLLPAVIVSGTRGSAYLDRDETIYGSAAPYPGEIVTVSEPYIHRRMRMVDVTVYPVQFHPAEQRVRLIEALAIRLNYGGGTAGDNLSRLSKTERMHLKQRVLNFDQAHDWVMPLQRSLQKSSAVDYDFNSGDWFKIPVSAEGIYKITGSFLQSQSINISQINSTTLQMFNYGGKPLSTNVADPRPADLNEISIEVTDLNGNGSFDTNDAIYFYGNGPTGWRYDNVTQPPAFFLNPYSFQNYYLLTFNQNPGKRIVPEGSPQFSNATRITRFNDYYRFEEERENILASGLDWYWLKFSGTSAQQSVSLTLPQNIITENATLEARFKGGAGVHYYDNSTTYQYAFTVNLNGVPVIANETFTNKFSRNRIRPTTAFRGGSNEFTVQYAGNNEGCIAYLDYLEVSLERPFIAENNFLKFYYRLTDTPVEFNISSLPAGTNRVWDVSDFANVTAINPLENGSTVRFQQATNGETLGKQYYAFGEAAVRNVEQISRIENSPNLRDPQRRGKLLLIVPDEFYDAAAAWEDLKESRLPEGIETERVKLSEIYREFSSGVADPTAIRDFIKYAYENWSTLAPEYRPEYVQLLGDGSYDYRNIELTSYINRVPVFEITANDDINSRVTDNYFTAIDNFSNGMQNLDPQLAIARLPANSVTDIENYLIKMREYEYSFRTDPNNNGWQTVLTFVADDECAGSGSCNEWFHLDQTEGIVSRVPAKFDIKKIYLVDYDTQAGGLGRLKPKANSDLLDQVNRGTLMINFFGHGDPNTWAHEQVLTKARDLPLIKNGAKLPVWIAATCTWGKYDDPNIPSMAEEMVWEAEGGGIASIAASRPSFAFENERFAQNTYTHLFNEGSNLGRSILLGDAVQMSVGGGDNDQKYHIFGDVTLQLADPEHNIQIESISADTLKALSKVSVDASIYDAQGNFLPNFNGKAVIRVFDAVDSTANLGVNYTYTGGTIFKGIVNVRDGKIDDASFIVPKSIKYKNSRTGRISIYAWDEDLRDAVGYNNTLLFYGSETQVNDAEGPEIAFNFPEQPDFFEGDYVGQQPTIAVELSDENGINLTGEVGHRIELTIDDRIKKDVTEFFVYHEDEYTTGELRYTLPALSAGSHRLKISAWDNLNNYSEEEVYFTTTSASELTLAQVVNYPNPFENDTQFTFQYQSPNGLGEISVKIYTVTGRLIQEIQDVARPGFNKIYWDGRDRDGDQLANGVYLYKITVNDGQNSIEKIDKLAIVR